MIATGTTSFSFKGFLASIFGALGIGISADQFGMGLCLAVAAAFFAMMREPERSRSELLIVLAGAILAAIAAAAMLSWAKFNFPVVLAMMAAGYFQRKLWHAIDRRGEKVIETAIDKADDFI